MNHTIEVSPSSRAACRSCGQKIAKGELRLGEAVASQYADTGFAFEWHHLACAAEKKPLVLRAALGDYAGEIANRAELTATMDKSSAAAPTKTGTPGALPTADLAPTGRAKCIQCSEAIPAKSIRIGVEREIDTGRFATKGAGYLHPACVVAWVESENRDLAELVAQVAANSSLNDLPAPFGNGAAPAAAAVIEKTAAKAEPAKAETTDAVPPFDDLTEKALRALGKKLNGIFDPNSFKHDALVEKTVEGKRRADLYWYLVQYRLVEAEKNAGLLHKLAAIKDRAPQGVLVPLLSRLTSTPKELYKNYNQGERYLLPNWLRVVDELAVEALRTDRAALEAALPNLPPDIRLGVEFVRGRSGLKISDADRKAITKNIVQIALNEGGTIDFPVTVAHGNITKTAFEIDVRDCAETLPRLAALFGMDDAAWDEALEEGLAKGTWSTVQQVARGLKKVPLTELVKMLVSRSSNVERDPNALFSALDARGASPSDVVAAAQTLQAGYGPEGDLREALLVWALSRRAAKGEAFTISDLALSKLTGPLREGYLAIVRATPREEALALLRRDFGTTRRTSLWSLMAILSVHFDDAILRDYLAIFDNGWNAWASLGRPTAALFGPEALAALVDAYCDKDDPKRRDNLVADIVENIASRSGPLVPLEQAAVDALGSAVLDLDDERSYLQTDRSAPAARLAARLASKQRRDFLLEKIHDAKFPSQAFRLVPLETDRAFRVLATRALSERKAKLEDQDLRVAVNGFGDDAPKIFAEALGTKEPSATFLAAIQPVFGATALAAFASARGVETKNWYDQLKDLCAQAAGDHERIYLLEPPFRVADLDLRASPKSWSRLGGSGPGVDVPKAKSKTLEHVLTLDLDEAPELKKRFPGARAIALYVPDAKGGAGYELSKLAEIPASATSPVDGDPLFVLPLDVPSAIFRRDVAMKDPVVDAVRIKVLNASGYALGEPMWIQDPEPLDLVMQLSGSLGVNVGDSGSLYVAKDELIMQSH